MHPSTRAFFTIPGNRVTAINQAELVVPEGWLTPETFSVLAEDGRTPLYGAIWKPIGFDSTRRYPVLESSYFYQVAGGRRTATLPRCAGTTFWSTCGE